MKKTLIILILAIGLNAQWMQIDEAHTDVGFVVKHLGLANVKGNFKKYIAAIDFDTKDNTLKSLEAIIKADSINTQNERRDENLTSPYFFDTKKHTDIKFTMTDKGKDYIVGDLTMAGVKKSIKLKYIFNGSAPNHVGVIVHSFSLKGEINRKDFEIAADYPDVLISDIVRIRVEVEGFLQPE